MPAFITRGIVNIAQIRGATKVPVGGGRHAAAGQTTLRRVGLYSYKQLQQWINRG